MSTPINIVIGFAVIGYVVHRQVRVRPLTGPNARMLAVIGGIGLLQTYGYVHAGGTVDAGSLAAVLVGFAAAAALAWPRVWTMRTWRRADGVWMTRGTALTVAMWALAVGAHVTISLTLPGAFAERADPFSGLEQATVMLYLLVTLGVQSALRGRRIPAATRTVA